MANNYVLGRGKIYVDLYDANDELTGEVYLGNTPGFTINVESTTIDHFSADSPIDEKDASAVGQITRSGTITIDNINDFNLALFLSGESETLSQSTGSVTDESITVEQGRFYQLGVSSGFPAGARDISNVVVTDSTGTTTHVEGTDYNVDLTLGRIEIIEGGGIAGAGAEEILVDYDTASTTWSQVKTSADAKLSGAVRFVAENKAGANRDLYGPKVNLSPSGAMEFKGGEYQSMQLGVEFLVKDANTEAMYINGRPA